LRSCLSRLDCQSAFRDFKTSNANMSLLLHKDEQDKRDSKKRQKYEEIEPILSVLAQFSLEMVTVTRWGYMYIAIASV
jgi:hypothetical protein